MRAWFYSSGFWFYVSKFRWWLSLSESDRYLKDVSFDAATLCRFSNRGY